MKNNKIWLLVYQNSCLSALLLIMLVVMELRAPFKAYLLAFHVSNTFFVFMLFISIIKPDNIRLHLVLIVLQALIMFGATTAFIVFLGNDHGYKAHFEICVAFLQLFINKRCYSSGIRFRP